MPLILIGLIGICAAVFVGLLGGLAMKIDKDLHSSRESVGNELLTSSPTGYARPTKEKKV